MRKNNHTGQKTTPGTKGIFIVLVACMLHACDHITLHHSFRSLPTAGWMRNDTVCFDVAAGDSQAIPCSLFVEIRNRSDYPYQHLPLILSWTEPDSTQAFRDTLVLKLANEEGRWTGKGWGGLYQNRFPVTQHALSRGMHRISITHCLNSEPLTGINDIGIHLQRLHQPAVSARIDPQEDK